MLLLEEALFGGERTLGGMADLLGGGGLSGFAALLTSLSAEEEEEEEGGGTTADGGSLPFLIVLVFGMGIEALDCIMSVPVVTSSGATAAVSAFCEIALLGGCGGTMPCFETFWVTESFETCGSI